MKGQTMVSISDAIALHSSSSANVKFVDGSWFLMGRNGRQEFVDGPRIKGANYFDINDISSKESNLPHMMPPKALFGAAMDAMGISNDDHIIVYGSQDCVSPKEMSCYLPAMLEFATTILLLYWL
jgi:thiosulfate/3-mercaptopyruvate sulfurtransferase